jgi:hypothetical protein
VSEVARPVARDKAVARLRRLPWRRRGPFSFLACLRELHRAWALVHQGGCRAARACIILDHLVKKWQKMLVRSLI